MILSMVEVDILPTKDLRSCPSVGHSSTVEGAPGLSSCSVMWLMTNAHLLILMRNMIKIKK